MKIMTKITGAVVLAATLATTAIVPAQAQSFSFGFGFGNGGGGYSSHGPYWDNHGPRWNNRGNWRYRDSGRYYRPRGGVSIVIEAPRVRGSHVARCEARYQSYDRRTDSYLGYDGDWHRCRL